MRGGSVNEAFAGDAASVQEAGEASHYHRSGAARPVEILGVFLIFLRLGMTSFGGPVAHLGYLRSEFVARRRWLEEAAYADLVALCQFLPGPASSQVGIALGALRAGLPGAAAAWLGFTLPSAAIMIGCGYGLRFLPQASAAGWLHGLKLAAVAVVAQAVWSMARQFCRDRVRASLAMLAAIAVLAWTSAFAQMAVIALAALVGWRLLRAAPGGAGSHVDFSIGHRLAAAAWILFFALLGLLPAAVALTGSHAMALFDSFYRSGALVFGAAMWCCRCCGPRWFPRAGCPTAIFLPAMDWRRPCPARSSLSRPILAA